MSRLRMKEVQARMERAREDLAGQVFAWPAVVAAIGEAAGRGFPDVTLEPEKPVNLKGTVAAETTRAKLADAGFTVRWESRRDQDGREGFALVVSW